MGQREEPNGGMSPRRRRRAVCASPRPARRRALDEFSALLTSTPLVPLPPATVASIIYLIIWINLHFRLRDRELSLSRGFLLTMFLLVIGLVGTFPPVYQLFGR